MIAVKNSWATIPSKPALIAGIVISGFGLGSLIYTKLANLIVNPDNNPISEGADINVELLPYMLQIMAITLSATGLAAALMITEPPPKVTQQLTQEEGDLW